MAAVIERDGREHYEYVPTQVVAEYFRRVFRQGNNSINGIVYSSSRKGAQRCYCLFATDEQCREAEDKTPDGVLQIAGNRRAKIDFAKKSFEGDFPDEFLLF